VSVAAGHIRGALPWQRRCSPLSLDAAPLRCARSAVVAVVVVNLVIAAYVYSAFTEDDGAPAPPPQVPGSSQRRAPRVQAGASAKRD
jgi:hypothetical protein